MVPMLVYASSSAAGFRRGEQLLGLVSIPNSWRDKENPLGGASKPRNHLRLSQVSWPLTPRAGAVGTRESEAGKTGQVDVFHTDSSRCRLKQPNIKHVLARLARRSEGK